MIQNTNTHSSISPSNQPRILKAGALGDMVSVAESDKNSELEDEIVEERNFDCYHRVNDQSQSNGIRKNTDSEIVRD